MLKIKTLEEFLLTCQLYRSTLQFVAITTIDGELNRVILCGSDDCTQFQPGDYGRVVIGGFGESSIRDLLVQQQALYFKGSEDLSSIGRALCLVSAALELDDSSPEKTLNKQFGAYYEITLYENGEFIKLERVLFSFWEITIVDDTLMWIPTKMFYHEYIDGMLIVRRITIPPYKEENSGIWQDCYGINSFERRHSHDFLRTHISEFAPDPWIEVVNAKLYNRDFRFISSNPIIRFEKDGEKWKINPDFNELKKHQEAASDAMEEMDKK
ncbi:hypothetical protein D9O50_05895 [Oxalobacteraceae bacterium CAVE-383]|nr:hypothetical protein D9O50_05895 [Oxalobacteraceae bacterium CAVE-383]